MGYVNRKRQRQEEGEGGGRASASGESRLANWMLEQIAWGLLSPAQCQVIASLVEDEMQSSGCTPHSTVSQLANLGSRGRYVNNVWRDMQKLFGIVWSDKNLPSKSSHSQLEAWKQNWIFCIAITLAPRIVCKSVP